MEALQSSLASGKFSDLTITHGLGDHSWSAHRVVVFSQCPELEAKIVSINGKNFLHLDRYDYDAVRLLIEYLYGSDYSTVGLPVKQSLESHISVFNLAVSLSIPRLEELSVLKFRYDLNNHVNDPLIFFDAVRAIYLTSTPNHDGLRVAVLEAGISELRNILQGPHSAEFFKLTREVTEFQTEMYLMMLEHPNRPMEVVAPDLCIECGPREEDDGYSVTLECRGCGKEKTMTFN